MKKPSITQPIRIALIGRDAKALPAELRKPAAKERGLGVFSFHPYS
jgi:hypothetical protein